MERYSQAFSEALKWMSSKNLTQELPLMQSAYQYLQTGNKSLLPDLHRLKNNCGIYFHGIVKALPAPDSLDEYDRRILHILLFLGNHDPLNECLGTWLQSEKADQDVMSIVLAEYQSIGLNKEQQLYILAHCPCRSTKSQHISRSRLSYHSTEGQLTSAGRHLLSRTDDELKRVFASISANYGSADYEFVSFIATFAPAKLKHLADNFLTPAHIGHLGEISRLLLESDPLKCEAAVVRRFRTPTDESIILAAYEESTAV